MVGINLKAKKEEIFYFLKSSFFNGQILEDTVKRLMTLPECINLCQL